MLKKKFIELDSNMLTTYVHYNMLSKINHLLGWWCNGL